MSLSRAIQCLALKMTMGQRFLPAIFHTVRPTAALYLVGTYMAAACRNELLMVLGALRGHSKGRLFLSTTLLVLCPCGRNAAPPQFLFLLCLFIHNIYCHVYQRL
jgi:hypothetical protein